MPTTLEALEFEVLRLTLEDRLAEQDLDSAFQFMPLMPHVLS